jgi:hypothetical protein
MVQLSQWDGFWEVVQKHVTWGADIALSQIQNCPGCFSDTYVADSGFLTALESDVVAPARLVQQLLDAHPSFTRLYSTLSAAEMTVDPLFTFNATLPPVSNLHNADRIIECRRGYYESEAPWRIELPQGGVVRGGPSLFGIWPPSFDSQPANRRILRAAESGNGKVLEDNSGAIDADIQAYSESVPVASPRPEFPRTRGPNFAPGGGGTTSGSNTNDDTVGTAEGLEPSGGCSLTKSQSSSAWLLVLAAAGLLRGLRRRTACQPLKPCARP